MRCRNYLIPIVVAACSSSCPSGGLAAPRNSVQQEIREVLSQRFDAIKRGDIKTYAGLLADRLVFVNDDRRAMNKAALVKAIRDVSQDNRSTEDGFQVQGYGNVAIATYRQSTVEHVLGANIHGEDVVTETYVKQRGRWLLAARQETLVPHANHPAAKVDPTVYDQYVGEYQTSPNWIEHVSRVGDKLYEQGTSDQEKVEDVPLSDAAFVERGELGVVTFERDAAGKIVRLVLHLNSDDLVGIKIR